MSGLEPKEAIGIILEVVEATYGSLGFLNFRFHSIKPNSKESTYVIKYSFIPRSSENKRLYYLGKVNILDKKLFEIKEISEEDLTKDDN